MAEINPTEEFIRRNYEKTAELLKKVYSTESPLLKLVQDLGERYALCPASSHKDYYSAFPGGLCYHNLHVLQWMNRFAAIMAPNLYSSETLLKLSILHDIGKIGDQKDDLYLPTNEDWKRRNGQYYDVNPNMQFMRIPQRSLFLATQYGIPLTQEEYLAIMLYEGQEDEANSTYKYREPKLATILYFASTWAQKIEKENIIQWP